MAEALALGPWALGAPKMQNKLAAHGEGSVCSENPSGCEGPLGEPGQHMNYIPLSTRMAPLKTCMDQWLLPQLTWCPWPGPTALGTKVQSKLHVEGWGLGLHSELLGMWSSLVWGQCSNLLQPVATH